MSLRFRARASRSRLTCEGRACGFRVLLILLAAMGAAGGCQGVLSTAKPGQFAASNDRRVAKQAAAEKFPTPGDVGLAPASR